MKDEIGKREYEDYQLFAIGVGAGESKVRPVLGALRAGAIRTLVTDVATAEAVVALDAETRR